MPLLTLHTNCRLDQAGCDALLRQASAKVSALLNKPEDYVMVMVQAGQALYFAGSDDPAVYMQLKSLGLPQDSTQALSQALAELVQSELGVPPGRVYIEFSSPERHLWGWNGGTF